jgi:hypothetical protein
MTETKTYPRPLAFPKDRVYRIGHFLLILMMLPMLFPMTLLGMLFGRYGRALRHAAQSRQYAQTQEHAAAVAPAPQE